MGFQLRKGVMGYGTKELDDAFGVGALTNSAQELPPQEFLSMWRQSQAWEPVKRHTHKTDACGPIASGGGSHGHATSKASASA